ncbi:MAG: hypothetical protein GY861_00780, partial [bacterium]|nr:hypothetical protein [bacterium]
HLSGVTGKAKEQVLESLTMIQKALNKSQNQDVIRAEGICLLVYQTMNNTCFALITNDNLCGQNLDTSNSVPVVTIETVSDLIKEDQTKLLYIQKQFVIKMAQNWQNFLFCFDRAYFKLTDSRNLHILPYHSQFLSSRLIDCRCEQNSKLFYVYEESGCFTKDLSYLLTATNDQNRIEKR